MKLFMNRILFILIVFSGIPGSVWAASPFAVDEQGIVQVGGISWGTYYADTSWKTALQGSAFRSGKANGESWSGPYYDRRGVDLFTLTQRVSEESGGALRVMSTVKAAPPVEANLLMYAGELPVDVFAGREIVLDGEAVALPADPPQNQVLDIRRARRVEIPAVGGMLTIETNALVMLVDGRKFGGRHFSLRIGYDKHKGMIGTTDVRLTMRFASFAMTPLPLDGIANRAFADAVAGDGRGGWTDQGPTNDLRAFSPDDLRTGGIPFAIGDEGQTAVILSRNDAFALPTTATVEVPASAMGQFLYLVHASAYTRGKVGEIEVTYRNRPAETLEVMAARDVGNWWNPTEMPNAAVVWTGKVENANTGLYLSRFELAANAVERITFRAGRPMWMVVGATLASADIPLPEPNTFVVGPGPGLAPIKVHRAVKPGSALDFSAWTEAPAGQYGHVITTQAGHFAFADKPGERVRFFGANLNFEANFLEKPEARFLAKRLRQMGYNAVRIHHYDVLLAGGWNSRSYTIDAAMRDKLDYLIACMRDEGLYISTDLYTIRKIHEPKVAAFERANFGPFKALIPIMPEAMADWKRFARDFLTHVNPYTGMSLAEDPALFSICPVNEDTLWAVVNARPEVRAVWDAAFSEWASEHGLRFANDQEKAAAFNAFLARKHIAADREMRRFLREDLGCKALVTGNNWKTYRAQTPIRAHYDYVDNHGYWDHPNFSTRPWRYPYSHSQRSATADRAEIPRRLFLSRIDGLPFAVTEFNFVYPNRFRAEGGVLVGAYAALQDWDALFRFSWAHNREVAVSRQPAEGFDIPNDPINLLAETAIGLFWRRGDLAPHPGKAVYVVDREEAFAGEQAGEQPRKFAENALLVGLTKRVATRFSEAPVDDSVNRIFHDESPRQRYLSAPDGGRVLLDARGDFLAETAFSKALVVQEQSLDEGFVMDVSGGPATVIAGTLDGAPFAESSRILVLHLTDAINSGATFGEKQRYSILAKGSLPVLVRQGSATVALPDRGRGRVEVFALDLSGQRVAEVPVTRADGRVSFAVETIGPDQRTTLAYELVRK